MISACMTVSLRELRTAVREWACCGRVLDWRSRVAKSETHWQYCIVSLSKTNYPLLSRGSTLGRQEIVPT